MFDVASGVLTALALVAASFGYGSALLYFSGARRRRMPVALSAGAGLALLTALCGWLVAFGLFSRAAGLMALVPGLGWLALRAARDPPRPPRRPGSGELALVAVTSLIFAPRVLGAFNVAKVNRCDDWGAYYHLPKLLLESGALEEPFGFRRLGTLGVAPLLQSYFVPLWPTAGVRVTDAVLGGLLVWGVARSLPSLAVQRPSTARVEAFGLVGCVLSLSVPVTNASPLLLPLGSALLLLWLSTALVHGEEPHRAEPRSPSAGA